MTLRRRIVAALLCSGLVAIAAPAAADDATELERGKNSYDAGRYQEGAERFRAMLDPRSPTVLTDPTLAERARAYYVACLIALGQLDDADKQIETIFRNDPTYVPDPVAFPGKVIDRFTDVKGRFKVEIEAAMRARAEAERAARLRAEEARRAQQAYIAELERLASEETVVTRHSRWIAALPFGIGQFQNGQEGLGWVFLSSEAVLAGISIGSAIANQSLVSQIDPNLGRDALNWNELQARLSTTHELNLYSTAAFAAVALAGIVQAQAAFVPEVRETRRRPLPGPASSNRPAASPSAIGPTGEIGRDGFWLGVRGQF